MHPHALAGITSLPTGNLAAPVLIVAATAALGAACGWALTVASRRILASLGLEPRLLWPTWLTVVLTGGVWGIASACCLWGNRIGALPVILPTLAVCVVLWQIDRQHHRLPNVLVLGLYPLVAIGMVVAMIAEHHSTWASVAAGAALWLTVFALLHLVSRGRGMGLGDVKLAPLIGAVLGWFSWDTAILGLLTAFIIGGLWATLLLVSRRTGRHAMIAFGPFMILGLGIGLLSALTLAG